MNWSRFHSIVSLLITFLSLAFAALTFYYNREKTTILEISRVSDLELTKPLNIKKLSSAYTYDSIPVEHLWQSSFVITNKGETTIYGNGFEAKNIRGNAIRLHLTNSSRILAIEVVDATAEVSLLCDSLYFTQWRPNEYIEIKVLSDGSLAPELCINNRDIKDAQIIYTRYSLGAKSENARLIDIFPRAVSLSLWWIVIIFYAVMFIALSIAATKQCKQATDKTTKVITTIVWIMVISLVYLPLLWMF